MDNYEKVLNNIPFPIYFLNTLKLSVIITVLQLFTCSLAAYSFTKLKFPGRDLIFRDVDRERFAVHMDLTN